MNDLVVLAVTLSILNVNDVAGSDNERAAIGSAPYISFGHSSNCQNGKVADLISLPTQTLPR